MSTPTTAQPAAEYIPFARYDRVTKDFAWGMDGQVVGYAPTQLEGERRAREYASDMCAWHARCAREAAAAQAEQAEQERAAGVVEAQPAASAPKVRPAITPATAPVRRFLPASAREIAEAVHAARQMTDDQRVINALNRAYGELLHGAWMFDGERLVVPSRTRRGQRYTCTAQECECEAFAKGNVACWHRAAYILVSTAALPDSSYMAEQLAQADAIYAALQSPGAAEVSDLSVEAGRDILRSRSAEYARA